MIKIAHLIDDPSMGGVTVALTNFNDPRLTKKGTSRTVEVDTAKRIAPSFDDDVIVIHFTVSWQKLPFLAGLRLRNLGKRIILIEHSYTAGFEAWNVHNEQRFHIMLRTAYACVDDVIAVSQNQADWLSRIVKPSKVRAIAQGRNLKKFTDVKPIAMMPKGPIVFGAIGRFHKQKGFDDLIKASRMPAFDEKQILIAGAGEDEKRLRELAQGAHNIEFVGVADAVTFYEKVHCVVVPSRWEAFGLVATEAMATGRVVIANKVDGLREQVEGYGDLLDPGSVIKLSIAMVRIANLKVSELNQIGLSSKDAALGRYDQMITSWFDCLFTSRSKRKPLRASSAAFRKAIPIITSPGQ